MKNLLILSISILASACGGLTPTKSDTPQAICASGTVAAVMSIGPDGQRQVVCK